MNCDPIARWYRWLEYAAFGRALERRRDAFLEHVADARSVLVLGDGDGRALAALLRANRTAVVDAIDLSARMLALARARAGPERVNYCLGDALAMPFADAGYDLIVTHFFLDCFDEGELDTLAERIARAARPDARWVISEFRNPGLLVAILYVFFRITTGLRTQRLADYHPALQTCGFRLAREQRAWRGLLASELWVREG